MRDSADGALVSACAASASSTSPAKPISPSSTRTASVDEIEAAAIASAPTATPKSLFISTEMGADCVKKLRGMFALAIYDKTKRKLILAATAWARSRCIMRC
jgi:hypothetical protein